MHTHVLKYNIVPFERRICPFPDVDSISFHSLYICRFLAHLSQKKTVKLVCTYNSDDVIMTLESELKNIFEFNMFKLCHLPNLIAVEVKMLESRRKPQCAPRL